MPKRYHVVEGSKFHWEYIDDDKWLLLAESYESFDTEELAMQAIDEMKKSGVKKGRNGKEKPPKPPKDSAES